MRKLPLAAAVLLASFGTTYARNTTTVLTPSPFAERVPYQSSELTTETGIRDLRVRVRKAANRVCAPASDTFMVTYVRQKCTYRAVRDAFAQINRAIARRGSDVLASAPHIAVRAR